MISPSQPLSRLPSLVRLVGRKRRRFEGEVLNRRPRNSHHQASRARLPERPIRRRFYLSPSFLPPSFDSDREEKHYQSPLFFLLAVYWPGLRTRCDFSLVDEDGNDGAALPFCRLVKVAGTMRLANQWERLPDWPVGAGSRPIYWLGELAGGRRSGLTRT